MNGVERGGGAKPRAGVAPPRQGELRAPSTSAARAKQLGDQAATLERGQVDQLLRASGNRQIRQLALPEVHGALGKISQNHPDPATRRLAAQRSSQVKLDAHLVDLRRNAHDMKAAGKKGVEIWSDVAKRSVDFHLKNPALTNQQRWDHVMADVATVFNGPAAKRNLDTYDNTIGRLSGSDPNVANMRALLGKRDAAAGFAGSNVDSTKSADFKRAFNDGTANQVFHTNFFNLLGYSAGKHDPRAMNIPNIYHETIDGVAQGGGGSVADWNASAWGLQVGNFMRQMRDEDKDVRAMPSLIGGAFSNHPGDFAQPWGAAGPDFTDAANGMDRAIRANGANPFGPGNEGAANFQRGLVRIFSLFQ